MPLHTTRYPTCDNRSCTCFLVLVIGSILQITLCEHIARTNLGMVGGGPVAQKNKGLLIIIIHVASVI